MQIYIDYDPVNWNEYINIERTNFYKANKIKQQEKQVDYLKYVNKKQEHEIQELSILLNKKIRFMKEMRKVK